MKAKPSARPVDIRETYRDTMKRFPKTMALLAGLTILSGCAPHVRYISTPCLTQQQYDQQKQAEPPKIHDKLTGKADQDIRPIAGSAVRLRAWGEGMLGILEGCRG